MSEAKTVTILTDRKENARRRHSQEWNQEIAGVQETGGNAKVFCDFSHLSMLFAFYQWLLQAISSFKQPCTRCQTVKTGVWQCQDGHLGCYTFFIQIIENASNRLYRAWHFTSSFMLLEATVGKAQEERRRMLSGLTATVSNNVKSMNTNMTQANQNKHLVYFVWTCQSEDCENMQWAHETV